MLKRLAKSRRHSADEFTSILPSPLTLEQAPEPHQQNRHESFNSGQPQQRLQPMLRKSCSDAPEILEPPQPPSTSPTSPGHDDGPDYHVVTAVPAYIVEHHSPGGAEQPRVDRHPIHQQSQQQQQTPENKQKGLSSWGFRRMGKKIESFRRSCSRETISTIHENHNGSQSQQHTNNNNNNNNNNQNHPNNNNNTNNNHNDLVTSNNHKNSENLDSTNNNNSNSNNANNLSTPKNCDSKDNKKPEGRRFLPNSHRSPSPFKSFFIRMGSTGMLNSHSSSGSKSLRRASQNLEDGPGGRTPTDRENLFRSCSTSQLNTSPTYVKGDDPSEGIDLRMSPRPHSTDPGKTLSCDNLQLQRQQQQQRHRPDDDDDEVFEPAPSTQQQQSTTFVPCDFKLGQAGQPIKKASSCDFNQKEAKKSNFPYAFLRSRLSVLPEEKHHTGSGGVSSAGQSGKEERLFKTTSEEHFPAMMRVEVESFEGTTTLGRRRTTRNGYPAASGCSSTAQLHRLHDPTGKYARNSYSEFKEERLRFADLDEYGFRMGGGALINHHQNGLPEELDDGPTSLPYQHQESATAPSTPATTTTGVVLGALQLRSNSRRNSVPGSGTTTTGGEQRLSSHYVSSNESGYDSDGGGRGENEAASLKCNTDSSDTSSVVDSEIEKPMRSSTPSDGKDSNNPNHQHQQQQHQHKLSSLDNYLDLEHFQENVEAGFRWHQTTSGRLLPSIHQTNSAASSPLSLASSASCSSSSVSSATTATAPGPQTNGLPARPDPLEIQASAHRVRLQQDKTKFLTDIIQPPSRIRRCRMIQLLKSEPKESLGIGLAQQRIGEVCYVVVQLDGDGIAHRDGRLRLGDEIVEVEGKDLRTLNNLEEVQEYLRSCEGTRIHLKTAYEETVPQIYPEDDNYPESRALQQPAVVTDQQQPDRSSSPAISELSVASTRSKRPDYLPLASVVSESVPNGPVTSTGPRYQAQVQQQQYVTRHVARFEKGSGKPSLGFSVVGGRDSPRGEMGIFVRRVFPGGQADVSKALYHGDEILTLNGKVLRGCTHQEVIELFKGVREGPVELELARRHRYQQGKAPLKSAPY